MNWEAIGAIGEIAGAIVVATTLIVLVKQVRDTSKQLTLNSTTEANNLYSDAFAPIYNNEHNLRVWVHGLRDPELLNEDDVEVFMLFMSRLMAVFDTVAEHHAHGTFPEERFDNYRNFAAQFLQTPGGRAWYKRGQYIFSEAGRDQLKGVLSEFQD